MSTQRLAIVTALATHNLMRNGSDPDRFNRSFYERQDRPNGTQFHGNVNYLLGGAMLSVMLTLVCFICYCCHRNMRKRSEAVYRQRWLEAEANMEIYSVAQCFDHTSDLRERHLQPTSSPVTSSASPPFEHGPPPSYDAVVAMDEEADACDKCAKRMCCRTAQRTPMCSCALHQCVAEQDAIHQILNVTELHRGCRLATHPLCHEHSSTLEWRECNNCDSSMDSVRIPTTLRSCNNGTCCQINGTYNAQNNQMSTDMRRDSSTGMNSLDTSTSTPDINQSAECDQNGNRQAINQDADSTIELSSINNNGVIRVDMSQIIDRTGLPTYEAALKLESSGYV